MTADLAQVAEDFNAAIDRSAHELSRAIKRAQWSATMAMRERDGGGTVLVPAWEFSVPIKATIVPMRERAVHPLCDPEAGECGACDAHSAKLAPCSCEVCHEPIAGTSGLDPWSGE